MDAEKGFIGYEYKEVTVPVGQEALYADGYPNFGYEAEGSQIGLGQFGSVSMKFKRDRKIRNKAELTRLQHQFDAGASELVRLENSKSILASVWAYVIGVIGCAFMAGAVFAITGGSTLWCILLGIPGLVGFVVPYFVFRLIQQKKTAQVTPLIENKYDELYSVCEKAHALLPME